MLTPIELYIECQELSGELDSHNVFFIFVTVAIYHIH